MGKKNANSDGRPISRLNDSRPLSVLKNTFDKREKLLDNDLHFHPTNQKGEQNSHENLSDIDGYDIVD